MQVEVSTEQETFKPVTVSLKFETQEELNAFLCVTGYNSTIAKELFKTNKHEDFKTNEQDIRVLLGRIYHEMTQVIRK